MVASPLVACGGQTTDNNGPCKLSSAGSPQSCTTTTGANVSWQATVSGDPTTCGIADDGGSTFGAPCDTFCGATFGGTCSVSGSTVTCVELCAIPGRPHAELAVDEAPSPIGVGGFFAHAAWFEAASVDAFEILARDLREHGAPERLVRGARAARRDEERHADMASAFAEKHGAHTSRPAAPKHASRDLEAIATENAVEGCVNETFSAALAMWQAERAAPEHRAHFAKIARDEARHAALAARVDAWIMPCLDDAARARVEAARAAKWDALERAASSGLVGLPSTHESRALARALRNAV